MLAVCFGSDHHLALDHLLSFSHLFLSVFPSHTRRTTQSPAALTAQRPLSSGTSTSCWAQGSPRKQDVNSDHRMSTRLNKKRKGRGNHLNRERTVTTLTEGSEGSFMASDEPLTSSPFSVASSTGPTATTSTSFSTMSSGFPSFSYGFMPGAVIPPAFSQSSTPAHFYPAQSLPSGHNDLEILERLKDTIKKGQHELFDPVPRPAALASVYLGPHGGSHVPPHPEQIPHDHHAHGQNGRHVRSDSTASNSDTRKASGPAKLPVSSSSVRRNTLTLPALYLPH